MKINKEVTKAEVWKITTVIGEEYYLPISPVNGPPLLREGPGVWVDEGKRLIPWNAIRYVDRLNADRTAYIDIP